MTFNQLEPASPRGRYEPLSPGHPLVGHTCPLCRHPLATGVRVTLMAGPPTAEQAAKVAYNAECVAAHETCAYP